jgi:hypothetical protein
MSDDVQITCSYCQETMDMNQAYTGPEGMGHKRCMINSSKEAYKNRKEFFAQDEKYSLSKFSENYFKQITGMKPMKWHLELLNLLKNNPEARLLISTPRKIGLTAWKKYLRDAGLGPPNE